MPNDVQLYKNPVKNVSINDDVSQSIPLIAENCKDLQLDFDQCINSATLKLMKAVKCKFEKIEALSNVDKLATVKGRDAKKRYNDIVIQFWENMYDDLRYYEKALEEPVGNQFDGTWYKDCPSCLRICDKTFWAFEMVGFRRRTSVSEYKNPVKNVSVVLIFLSGIFKLIRANQDGKASFVGNWIQIFTNILIIAILLPERDWAFILPKAGAIVVSVLILYGIWQNTKEGESWL